MGAFLFVKLRFIPVLTMQILIFVGKKTNLKCKKLKILFSIMAM